MTDIWRYVLSAAKLWRHHRLQGALCMLGVVVGVSGLVVAISVGEGARREIDRAIELLGAGTMVVRAIDGPEGRESIRYDRALAVQRLLNGRLRHQVPVLTDTRSVSTGSGRLDQVQVIGTDRSYGAHYRLRPYEGRFITWHDNEAEQRVCVLGWDLGRELFPQGNAVGQRLKIGRHWYSVVGWLEPHAAADEGANASLPSFDRVVYVPLRAKAIGAEPELDELILSFDDETDMLEVSPAVQRILQYGTDAGPLEYIMPIEMMRQKYRMQSVVRYLLSGITLILLTIGGVGIMNVMLVNVIRRRPEIGLRRAVGASRRDIITQFVTESVLVSVLGGVAGVAIGLIVTYMISINLAWPVAVLPQAAMAGLALSIVVGMLSGSYPARQAAAITPIKTLNQVQ